MYIYPRGQSRSSYDSLGGGGGGLFQHCPPDATSKERVCHPTFSNFGQPHLRNYVGHCFQNFTECRAHLVLPVIPLHGRSLMMTSGQSQCTRARHVSKPFPSYSETETLKTLPSHHTSYVRGRNKNMNLLSMVSATESHWLLFSCVTLCYRHSL